MKALIFNCDGAIVDSERDGHRVAFNEAFKQMGINVDWNAGLYGSLLKIAGGKERLRYYFDIYGWPRKYNNRELLIRDLHELKTDNYMKIIRDGKIPLRTGILRLIDESFNEGILVAICSASSEQVVHLLADRLLGAGRKKRIAGIFAGDMVNMKKPDPAIYDLASRELKTEPRQCVVIEDSRIGLLAATGAGMRCVITKSVYTQNEDFFEADAVYSGLGEPPAEHVTLDTLRDIK
jgi:HAD superfamily hydrolase (TIGR01509 family)